MNVTHADIVRFGFVITTLFDALYPSGTTLEQMDIDAAQNGWICAVLPSLTSKKEMDASVDVSEVGM